MKLFQTFLFLAAATLAVSSQAARISGSGVLKTESRPVADVRGVDFAGVGVLTIIQGDAESFEAEAEDNLLPLLETVVNEGVLRIGFKGGAVPSLPVKMTLKVKALDKVQLSGSGTIRAEKLTAPDALEASLVGSGVINLKGVDCARWTATVTGSGDVKVAGKAREQKVDVTGSGDYESFGLETAAANVTIAGSGDCEINATEKLNVVISGSGDVDYVGKPVVTKKLTGSGEVTLHVPGAAE